MSDFDMYESEIEDLYRPKEEPKVVLTVEEAKAIHTMLYNYVWEYAFELTDYDVKLPDDLLSRIKQVDDEFNGEYLRFYEERIEQAESKDEGN